MREMELYCTLENEMFRYSYGNINPWGVPFEERVRKKICCVKNDWAVTQLLLYSNQEMMVSIGKDPAFYEKGALDTVRAEVSWEEGLICESEVSFVELVKDDDGNDKSEVLLHTSKKYQEKRKILPIWIEVRTKKETRAGIYQGKIRIYYSGLLEDEVLERELTISLEVLDICLPDLWEGNFQLDLWQHSTSIARTYEVPLWSEEHFTLLEQYISVLRELGQKSISVIVSEAPWSGQWSAYYRTNPSDYFEYNMVSVSLDRDGNWHYDFGALNRYIELCLNYHIDKEIEIFGLLGIWTMEDAGFGKVIQDSNDAVRIRYYCETDGTYQYIRKKEDLKQYILALDQNIYEHGWHDFTKVVCDEPGNAEKLIETLSALKQWLPHIKFKVTICDLDVVLKDLEGVDDYVVNLPLVLSENEHIRQIKQEKSCTMSYYVAVEPAHPNTFLSCHLAESRFLPWLTWYLHMDGFLRWAIWLWPNKPFETDSYHYQKFRAGGTHFIYPGKNGKPLYSMRYKNLKRGIRDYLIFELYKEKTGKEEEIEKAIESVMKVENIQQMQGKYRKTAEEILSLNWKDYEEAILLLLRRLVS